MADDVALRLPAGTEYGRVARATAAALARRHGFSAREVEDLRLAVDEAIIALLDEADRDAAMSLRFSVGDDALTVWVTGAAGRPAEATRRFEALAAELVDTAAIDPATGTIELTLVHEH